MNTEYIDIHELHDAEGSAELIERFKRYGTIIHTIKRGKESATIGKINDENVFVVFYPDGEFDRFDARPIEYRSGWRGPDLTVKATKSITVMKVQTPEPASISVKTVAAVKKTTAKRPAKRNEAVDAWFALLGSEKPKIRTKKSAASKKSSTSMKH